MYTGEREAKPNGRRVLIVDDDRVFLKATATRLQLAGFDVRTATENSEAIAALDEQPADTVVMDIHFPPDVANGGMGSWNGFRIMHWMRGLPAGQGTRFIMVFASDAPSYQLQAQQHGAVTYFKKPVDYQKLINDCA